MSFIEVDKQIQEYQKIREFGRQFNLKFKQDRLVKEHTEKDLWKNAKIEDLI